MLSRARHRNATSCVALATCVFFLVNVSCAETMRVPVRDLEKLNEKKKTYHIRTEDGQRLYASEVAWTDTLVTILELDPEYHPESTDAVPDSLPLVLPVDDIESIERIISGRTMGIPMRDLEALNEEIKKTYLIQTKDGLELYASEVAWTDTLVTISELNPRYHPDSTDAMYDSLPIILPVEEIESIGRVTTDKEEATGILLISVGTFCFWFLLIPYIFSKIFDFAS